MANQIELDASSWKSEEDFYTSYCTITKAPDWFGKNLDAFADSLRGGICRITPEKIIVKNLTSKTKNKLGSFWNDVVEICLEEEVELEVQSN